MDLTYSKDHTPNPTEINIGRLFTTHHFFTVAGINFPYILMKLAFGEEAPHIPRRINPLTPGMAWVRGMDMEPVFTTERTLDLYEEELEKRKLKLKMMAAGRPKEVGSDGDHLC